MHCIQFMAQERLWITLPATTLPQFWKISFSVSCKISFPVSSFSFPLSLSLQHNFASICSVCPMRSQINSLKEEEQKLLIAIDINMNLCYDLMLYKMPITGFFLLFAIFGSAFFQFNQSTSSVWFGSSEKTSDATINFNQKINNL